MKRRLKAYGWTAWVLLGFALFGAVYLGAAGLLRLPKAEVEAEIELDSEDIVGMASDFRGIEGFEDCEWCGDQPTPEIVHMRILGLWYAAWNLSYNGTLWQLYRSGPCS